MLFCVDMNEADDGSINGSLEELADLLGDVEENEEEKESSLSKDRHAHRLKEEVTRESRPLLDQQAGICLY